MGGGGSGLISPRFLLTHSACYARVSVKGGNGHPWRRVHFVDPVLSVSFWSLVFLERGEEGLERKISNDPPFGCVRVCLRSK